MPSKLSTTISKIRDIPNLTNSSLVGEFYEYMKTNDASERHQNNSLKMVIAFANYLGKEISFYVDCSAILITKPFLLEYNARKQVIMA